ncbi:hypothetical protein K1X84_01825 [bacterium]|nr:hypothetical protein [bacterium]
MTLFKEIRFYLLIAVLLFMVVPDNSDNHIPVAQRPFFPANFIKERYSEIERSLEVVVTLTREENLELINTLENLYIRIPQPSLQAAIVRINGKVQKNDVEIHY